MQFLSRRVFLFAAGLTLLTGCATAGTQSTTQYNIVTAEELGRAGDVSLYDALTRIRPTFLRARGAAGTMTSSQQVTVYVGELKMEGPAHLREIMARTVNEVRYYEPAQANARFGGNNAAGAVVVLLK